MSVSSVLIGGGGIAGCAAAVAIAQRGVEVTLVGRSRQWPHAGTPIAVRGDVRQMLRELGVLEATPETTDALDPQGAIIGRLREAGVEVRPDTELVGFVHVDHHLEVELSDERIENYDVLVVTEGPAPLREWRVIASGDEPRSDAVAAVTGALTALNRGG